MAEKLHSELNHLTSETLEYARFARSMLADAISAVEARDLERATGVVPRKTELSRRSYELEEQAYRVIALYQPMAVDLRTIACAITIIYAAERIGRYGKDIANIVAEISDQPHPVNLVSIPHMGEMVLAMIDDALSGFATASIDPIENFSQRDDRVDALRYSIFRECLSYMLEDSHQITRNIYYVQVARYLERCGDHACKIAEKVYYMVTGDRVEIR